MTHFFRIIPSFPRSVAVLALSLLAGGPFLLADGPVTPVIYSPHVAKFDCHMNMGPTGAKAWMRGYHFQVVSIDQESPADGLLMLGDLVIGANGTKFGPDADPRMTLGNAIGEAEATGQPLKLTVRREGRKRKVKIDLPAIGPYSPTWPAKCTKSAHILDTACRQLRNAQVPNGAVITDGNMGTFLTGLLLLASGDPAYLDSARRAAYNAASIDYREMHYKNWGLGYGGVLLAEYYLSTGDDSVLESLAGITEILSDGQMKCGSWGHNSPGAGYGALNQVGGVCAIALVLAQECGIDVDQEAIDDAVHFFGRYAMLGSTPYGDHGPGGEPDHNGRSASSAILMHLVGRQDHASAFSRSVALSYWRREEGHTGGFFSFLWGPLAARLAGQDKMRTFLDYQKWYYNLSRTWRGDLVHLPYQEALTRFDSNGYVYFGGDFTTGGIGLLFAMPEKRLRILGAPKSVFSPKAPLNGALLDARNHYLARNWPECDRLLASIDARSLDSPEGKHWLAQLRDARALTKASTEKILLEVNSNLVDGAAYRASQQYEALKRCLGEDGDTRFSKLDERFAQGTVSWYVREGKQYYEAWGGLQGFAIKSWVPQGWQAKSLVEVLPSLRQLIWEPLSPTSEMTAQTWRTLLLDKGETLPKGWQEAEFDDKSWKQAEGIFVATDAKPGESFPKGAIAARRGFNVNDPRGVRLRVRLQTVRPAETRVYLNGQLVVDAVRGQRGGYAAIELDDGTLELLHEGENVLAVTSTQQGSGNNHLDVGLEICRSDIDKRFVPVRRLERIPMTRDEDDDFNLRVRETQGRMQQKMQASYDRKTIDALLGDLGDPVAYRRGMAENALVGRGLDAIQQALGRARHPDWKVRGAVCEVIRKALGKQKRDKSEALQSLLQEQIPVLTEMLGDEHYWVRNRAASALSGFGESARPAIPELQKLVTDPEEWVRNAAIQAIRAAGADPEVAVAAALETLEIPTTAYSVPRVAVGMLTAHPGATGDRLGPLLSVLRHPPEGGGGRLLNQVMDMAATLDPEGRELVPVLIEAASDKTHYSRQRGNPRGKAIEVLASYGAKAEAAVPVLKGIVASEEKKDQGLKEPAAKALSAITGENRSQ